MKNTYNVSSVWHKKRLYIEQDYLDGAILAIVFATSEEEANRKIKKHFGWKINASATDFTDQVIEW